MVPSHFFLPHAYSSNIQAEGAGERVDLCISVWWADRSWVNRSIEAICRWEPGAQAHCLGPGSRRGGHAKLDSRCDRQCSLAINQQAGKLKGQRVANGTICLTVRDWISLHGGSRHHLIHCLESFSVQPLCFSSAYFLERVHYSTSTSLKDTMYYCTDYQASPRPFNLCATRSNFIRMPNYFMT